MPRIVFKLCHFDDTAKSLDLACADGDLCLSVDWDDVNHHETAVLLRKMLAILNRHWDDPAYAGLSLPQPPDHNGPGLDMDEEDWWERQYRQAKRTMKALENPGLPKEGL